MHASARRRPDLELPTADGMYVIAVNQTFGDRGWAKLIRVDRRRRASPVS